MCCWKKLNERRSLSLPMTLSVGERDGDVSLEAIKSKEDEDDTVELGRDRGVSS